MNNAPLTLILIASLGIVAVISLGVFFAVRPKFAGTEEHLAADVLDQKQLYSSETPPIQLSTQAHPPSPIGEPSQHSNRSSSIAAPSAPPIPVAEFTPGIVLSTADTAPPGGQAQSATSGRPIGFDLPHSKAQPGEPTFGQSSRTAGNREIVSTVELLDSLRVAPGFGTEQDLQATARIIPDATSSPPPRTKPTNASETRSSAFRELGLEKELDMHRYGKVVGLAYRKGRLYVPSYQNGNVSVYKAETLELLKEYTCPGCHIYDIAVLSNGDMVLAQGKFSKLTILNSKNGAVVKETSVPYSTKGIAVSPYDELFVLSREKDSIFVYDRNLTELAILPLDINSKTEKNDCNFVAYGADLIYVSCELSTLVIDVQGKQVQTLKPVQATYAIGVTVDNESGGQVFVGQRGKSLADIYDKNGKYLKTVGEGKDSLWSDIVVGGKHLFAIEYITATIKQYRLR